MAEMIPPAVIDIQGDDAQFVRVVGEVKAMLADLAKYASETKLSANAAPFEVKLGVVKQQLADFGKQLHSAKLSADVAPFESKLTLVKQQLLDFAKQLRAALLGADAAPFWADVAKLRAEVDAMSPLDLKVDANTAAALAKIEALRGALASASVGALIAGATGGGGGDGGLAALLGAAAGAEGGGGGGGAGLAGWLGRFLTPSIGAFGRVGGPLGTMLALSGLSVEHMAVAGLDMASGAAGGLVGALIKGMAGAGVLAVGMGSNMLVGSSTMADIRQMYALMNPTAGSGLAPVTNYAQAMKELGLPQDAGTRAEWAQAQALTALNSYWDTATSSGRVAATKLYASFETAAKPFIALINWAATKNFSNLTKDLKPFFQWLDSMGSTTNPGGLRIFKELEDIFASHTATGTSAFINAFESLAKIIAYVAPRTGGFLKSLDKFFSDLNVQLSKKTSPAKTFINNMLQDWQAFYGFLKELVKDIVDLFNHGKDQRSGLAIFQTLTGFLDELNKWENSASGTSSIKTFLKASKGEILAFLSLIPPMAKAIGSLFLAIAPAAHRSGTLFIKGIVDVLNAITLAITKLEGTKVGKGVFNVLGTLAGVAGTIIGLAVPIGMLAQKFKVLQPAIRGILTLLVHTPLTKIPGIGTLLQKALGKGSPSAVMSTAANTMLTASENMMAAAEKMNLGGAGGVGPIGSDVTAAEKGGGALAGAAGVAVDIASKAALLAAPALIGSWLVHHGQRYQLSSQQEIVARYLAAHPITRNGAPLSDQQIQAILATVKGVPGHTIGGFSASGGTMTASQALAKFFGLDKSEIAKVIAEASKTGHDVSKGFSSGIKKGEKGAAYAATGLGAASLEALRKATGSHSPSVLAATIGLDLDLGLVTGMQSGLGRILAEEQRIAEQSLKTLRSFSPDFQAVGRGIMSDVAAGVRSGSGELAAAIHAAVQSAMQSAVMGIGISGGVVAQLRGGTSW